MSEFPDFQPYLKSICDRYQKWWQLYTLTDAAGKERQSKSELQSPFDFGLMVQTVGKENRDPRDEEKERIERFPVLEGIRKYADQHVLLVGRPGSGKSTTLARLLLELAEEMLVDETHSKPPTTIRVKGNGNETAQAPASRALTYAERQRLEKRRQDLQGAWDEATEKLSRLRQAWVIETDVADKFKLEKQIQAEEAAIQQWEDDLSRIEQILSRGIVSTLQTTFAGQIPVLVELRAWQTSVLDLIRDACKRLGLHLAIEQIQTMLDECQFILLMDGLNELPSEAARTDVFNFRHNHPRVPMIFTTRDLSIGGDLGIEEQLEMQPLTETQMQAFIRSYVPEQAEPMLRQLKDRLRELGQTPLLLWMMCELFRQTGEIPDNLGMVFRLFTQGYERNLKQDVVIESDRAWWKPVLQQLAWVMMQGEKPTELRVAISREEAVRAIAQFLNGKVPYAENFAQKCLRDLQNHHLIQMGTNPEELEFRHQLIQEYYAAEALLQQLPKLDDEQLKQEFLNFLKWTEPIALMLGLADEGQALRVVEQALEIDWRLAARLAGEVKQGFQEKTIDLINALITPNWLKVRLLGETRSSLIIPTLLQQPKDELGAFSNGVIRALRLIGQAYTNPECVEAIKYYIEVHENYDFIESADFLVGKVPELLKILEKADEDSMRWQVAEELVNILNSNEEDLIEAIPELLKVLDNQSPNIRISSIWVLSTLNSPKAVHELLKAYRKLIEALEDSIYVIRWLAAEILGRIGAKEAIPNLLKALNDEAFDVRWRAAEALCKMNHTTEAIPELLKALEDDNIEVRWRAAITLGKLGFIETVPELVKSLKSLTRNGRQKTFEVLEKFGANVLPILLEVLEKESLYLQQKSTCQPGKEGFMVTALNKAKEDAYGISFHISSSVITLLEKLGSQVIPHLLKEFMNKESHVRWEAAAALGKLGAAEIIPLLLNVIQEEEVFERWEATKVLKDLGCVEEAIPVLLEMIKMQGDIHPQVLSPFFSSDAAMMLSSIRDEQVAYTLPILHGLIFTECGKDVFRALVAIQENCKYLTTKFIKPISKHRNSIDNKAKTAIAPPSITSILSVISILELSISKAIKSA